MRAWFDDIGERTSVRIRRRLLVLAGALLLAPGIAPAGPEEDALARVRATEKRRIELIERIAPAVGAVFKVEGGGGGSGVLISPEGHMLTNFHVTGLAKEMRVGLPDGRRYPAKVVGIDPQADIALMRLIGDDPFPYVELGDSDAIEVGDFTLAMGNPFLLATDFKPTVTMGIVSGVNRYQEGAGSNKLVYPKCIQVDTPINPGNSGGPLFDMEGRLLGINGRISIGLRGRNNVGVGYAVSINQVKGFLPYLRAGKYVEHGTLDATVRDEVGEDGRTRTVFAAMYEDSVAYRAGIRLGDELLAFDGSRIIHTNHFANEVNSLPVGWEVEVVTGRRDEAGELVKTTHRIRLAGIASLKESEQAQWSTDYAEVRLETKRSLARLLASYGPAGGESWLGGGDEWRRRGADTTLRRGDGSTLGLEDDKGWKRERGGDTTGLSSAATERLQREASLFSALASGDPEALPEAMLIGGDRIRMRVVDLYEARIGGVMWIVALDTETGDPLRASYEEAKGGVPVVYTFSDHRRVGDRRRPFRLEVRVDGEAVRTHVVERWSFDDAPDGDER